MKWPIFILQPLQKVDQENRAFLSSERGRGIDGKVIAILVSAALCLTLQRYVARTDTIEPNGQWLHGIGLQRIGAFMMDIGRDVPQTQLARLQWWVCVGLVANVVVPMFLIRLALRERLGDYGVKLQRAFADWWVYFVLFIIAAPLVYLASAGERFLERYPFYDVAQDGGFTAAFACWEVLYMVQFFGVEFFYRGFLLHGLKHRFGAYAIFVMMVPYCMLHFSKPMPETLAAIFGAIVLGFMSLRTRSILMGTAIHMTVALLMDSAALWRKGWI